MKPLVRFHTCVISLTTSMVFGLWYEISKLIVEYPEWFKDSANDKYKIIGFFASILVSVGFYRIIYLAVAWCINNIFWTKRLVFSSFYLEGTWVGFYIGVSGKIRYMIETYEQSLDGIVIKGMSFDENKNLHTFWTSESVNLDIEKGEISYLYKVKSTKDKTDPYGMAYFSFIRDINKKPPVQIIGYSEDAHFTQKCKAAEKKYSISTKFEMNEALLEAVNYYQSKKNIFPQINQQ